MTHFTDQDINQITNHKLTLAQIQQQITDFENGFPFIDIISAKEFI